ncbi:hypothetical protein ACFLZV_04120, partial [Candidatus Margulisiibacteriota bacterium]
YSTYPDTQRKVMTILGDGKIGIGTTVPSANLNVSGNFQVNVGDTVALLVSTNAYVGINTTAPMANLDVNGELMTNTLVVRNGRVDISTLDVKGTVEVYKNARESNIISIGQKIDVSITQDIQVPVTGLDITLKSEHFSQDDRGYALWGNGTAYGLKVDMEGLTVGAANLENDFAEKYAGIFLGGFVGIGTRVPKTGLHVQAPEGTDIAKFGSINGNITIHDYGAGIIGFYNIDAENDTTYHHTLCLAPGLSNQAGDSPGKVGIGIPNPDDVTLDKALVVNGDMRLGIIAETGSDAGEPGYGRKLWFSGGPDIDSDIDHNTGAPYTSENRDDIWMSRYNRLKDQSELHVNIGSLKLDGSNSPDRFAVGYIPGQGAAFKRIFQVVSNGKVGIQDGVIADDDIDTFPATALHVRAQTTGESSELKNHVAVFENNNSEQADTLAIYHAFDTGAGGIIPTKSHFITFFVGVGASLQEMGAIEGNNQSGDAAGVRFKTSGADYAEYLPMLDPEENIIEGNIVGVFNGKISKNTKDADQIMVISSSAGIAGNFPQKNEHLYRLVSFFGQVNVKVSGIVNVGDYIIPSGKNDGAGIAVPPENISARDLYHILGRAWEGSNISSVKSLKVAVGFSFSMPSLKKEINEIRELKTELQNIKNERVDIIQEFDSKLKAQNKDIELLLKSLGNRENK